jgi:serine protease Do
VIVAHLGDVMNDKPNTQIIIRHIAGAKINRIDPFALADTAEITFGREAGSSIMFDSPKDDVVSRRHAVLRVANDGEAPSFTIEDFKSSNGTFVNDERIADVHELLPEDTVEFGKGGPKFIFDVQPRPAGVAARTRAMTAVDSTTTRAVSTAAETARTGRVAALVPPSPPGPATVPIKTGVGKNTVMMLLFNERKKTSQVWMAALAAVVAFFLVGGGVLYWNSLRTADRLQQDAQAKIEQARTESNNATQQITQQLGNSAGDIVRKYGNSTVWISFSWRLFDKETGRPVFHKVVAHRVGRDVISLPAYFKFGDIILPWLTTEDEEHKNFEIKGSGTGSGFVVSENGFILTNKHVATGWNIALPPTRYLYGQKQAFIITPDNKREPKFEVVNLTDLPSYIAQWTPGEDGAVIFKSDSPTLAGANSTGTPTTPSNKSPMFGRNELLEVRFPGSGLSINATNVRQATLADAALIKVDSPQTLTPLEIAGDDAITVGERVIVLGYPGLSTETQLELKSTERGQVKTRTEVIPEPTVTEGIVSKLGSELTQVEGGAATIRNTGGDAFQLSINSTGAGNSGGPVFNAKGKVIGLYTYGRCLDNCVSAAVPIKHGRFLLNPQRTSAQ